jgi:hypothetical protein
MLRRLHLPTVCRLYAELATRAEADSMYHTYLETLIAEEIAHRAETRLSHAVHRARFPFLRTIDDFNFTFQMAVKLQMLGSYLSPELVSEGQERDLLSNLLERRCNEGARAYRLRLVCINECLLVAAVVA